MAHRNCPPQGHSLETHLDVYHNDQPATLYFYPMDGTLQVNSRLQKIAYTVATFLVLATIGGAWLSMRALSQMDKIHEAADDLELRKFRIAGKIRAQLHRLSATSLRYQLTGDKAYREQFTSYREELRSFVGEMAPALKTEEEKELLNTINGSLGTYFEEAEELIAARGEQSADGPTVERVERARAKLLEIVDLANQLGDSRREEFLANLGRAERSAEAMRKLILYGIIALVILFATVALLFYRAFIVPLKGQLSSAREISSQKEQLAHVGTLAAGIAHEIRNPITAMKARTFALNELVEKDSPASKQTRVIESELNRLERIVRDFLDYARPSEPNIQDVNISELLSDIEGGVRLEMDERGVAFALRSDSVAKLRIDPNQIRQVILNLLRNAAESCDAGGDGSVVLAADEHDGVVTITVEDNGIGIAGGVQQKIFEPFYTKKHGGTGLGLPIARTILRKHQSDLTLESKKGTGTRFRFSLK